MNCNKKRCGEATGQVIWLNADNPDALWNTSPPLCDTHGDTYAEQKMDEIENVATIWLGFSLRGYH